MIEFVAQAALMFAFLVWCDRKHRAGYRLALRHVREELKRGRSPEETLDALEAEST